MVIGKKVWLCKYNWKKRHDGLQTTQKEKLGCDSFGFKYDIGRQVYI